eukprot:TRINITY_DN18898_c0_g1_i1.p1 TRINITY_DN18898_c0_g1~~TRINITY_DN18898_c0_g1_i1.p1  ORF type:complete len:289 (+),score=68.78 TRINITY_DN18898_c0_g1_i1:68-934(+)
MTNVLERTWKTLHIEALAAGVLECRLNRPDKRNAMNLDMWEELREFFFHVAGDGGVKVILLTGAGGQFCSGLDFTAVQAMGPQEGADVGREALRIRSIGKHWQDALSGLERCGKVVIACIHGACIGGGVELIAAADVRFCTADSVFALKEVDLGIAADVGGLQRVPKLVGNQSLLRELVFSGRNLTAAEALPFGLVSRICKSREELLQDARQLAQQIAVKSPIALLGAKTLLNYSRDHSVDESLDYAITWNQGMIQSRDVLSSAMAMMTKGQAEFEQMPNLPAVHSKL